MTYWILSSERRYAAIKAMTCVENAVPSQVVMTRTLTKKTGAGHSMLTSVCTKIAMQMNCKMGGALWRLNILMHDTIILGYDTFHDTVNKKKFVILMKSMLDLHLKFCGVPHHFFVQTIFVLEGTEKRWILLDTVLDIWGSGIVVLTQFNRSFFSS